MYVIQVKVNIPNTEPFCYLPNMDIRAQGYLPTDFPWEMGKEMRRDYTNLCSKLNGKVSATMNFEKSCLLIQKLSMRSPKLRTFHVNNSIQDPECVFCSFSISLK